MKFKRISSFNLYLFWCSIWQISSMNKTERVHCWICKFDRQTQKQTWLRKTSDTDKSNRESRGWHGGPVENDLRTSRLLVRGPKSLWAWETVRQSLNSWDVWMCLFCLRFCIRYLRSSIHNVRKFILVTHLRVTVCDGLSSV